MNPSSGLALVVCEYCGAVTTMGAGGAAQVIQKHFMLNNRLNNETAMEAGGKWLNKGIFRRKVAERSELGAVTLRYVPYWVVPTSVVADFQGTKSSGVGSGTGMMMHGDGKQKAAGAALFALSIAATAANQNRNAQVSQPQVVRVRDRIQLQRNIPVVAVRGYAQYQPEDGFTFELANKMNFDKRQTGGVDVQSGDISESEAKAQAAALAKMKPGARGSSVDAAARTLIDRTKYKGRFIHGLGHSVGLAVHDPSTGLSPGSDLILRPNMVLTDEPGIYVPGFGGVRIEDDVLVTKDGPRVLSTAPREFLEL